LEHELQRMGPAARGQGQIDARRQVGLEAIAYFPRTRRASRFERDSAAERTACRERSQHERRGSGFDGRRELRRATIEKRYAVLHIEEDARAENSPEPAL